jgi:hypothetical protein
MSELDEKHAASVGGDVAALKKKVVELLRGAAGAIAPPADSPGAALVSGVRSVLPGGDSYAVESRRYNQAAPPSPLYSDDSKFGSVVSAPGAVGPTQGEANRNKELATQMAIVASMRGGRSPGIGTEAWHKNLARERRVPPSELPSSASPNKVQIAKALSAPDLQSAKYEIEAQMRAKAKKANGGKVPDSHWEQVPEAEKMIERLWNTMIEGADSAGNVKIP